MSNQQKNNLASTLLVVSGLILGGASVLFFKENKTKNAGKVLADIKERFASQGKIEGSWIDYNPITYDHFQSRPLVYLGGISRLEGENVVQYQIACDIYTGELVDIILVSTEPASNYYI